MKASEPNQDEKKYFLINRKKMTIAIAIAYLIAELSMVSASIYQASQSKWTAAIWFIFAAAAMRFYYTKQTQPPQP